jgi:cell division protein FtsI (penicillin-binding protein 3)
MNIKKREIFSNPRVKFIVIIMALLTAILLIRVSILSLNGNREIKTKTIKDRALRGSIISDEGYTIARSIKSYSASFHTKYLDPNKKEFFLKLFSIYSNIPLNELKKRLVDKNGKPKEGWVVLADNIDAKTAIYLKELKYKLNRFKVFKASGVNKNFYYGLTITEKGESREYPLKEALSPILGYTRSKEDNGYKYIVGFNGIEKFYEKYLNKKKDGLISGKRDAIGYIIHTKSTKYSKKENGYSLVLNINLGLQKTIDYILDNYKQKLGAKEVIAAVMRSKDSKIIAITSSNRYDPLNIKPEEIANLQPKATTYAYEPGSVLKPFTYALALDKDLIAPNTIFNTYNGKFWLTSRFKITDDEPEASLSAENIIIKSSNIGISQISWLFKGDDFRNGLLKFGLGSKKSGIDIGREAKGQIYSVKKLRAKVNKATTAYGYGIKATFAQLLKAYNVFNNNGVSFSPRVVNYIKDENGHKFYLKKDYTVLRPISKDTANIVKDTLIKNVEYGTGRLAKTEGLEVGGKTGTAMIAKGGRYIREYHTSFYGFANDAQGNRYTIGVLVIEPKYESHFASQSAVPVFKAIIDAMVEQDYLKPNINQAKQAQIAREKALKETQIKQKRQEKVLELKEKLRIQREQLIKHQRERIRRRKPKHHPTPKPAMNEPDLF